MLSALDVSTGPLSLSITCQLRCHWVYTHQLSVADKHDSHPHFLGLRHNPDLKPIYAHTMGISSERNQRCISPPVYGDSTGQ